MLPAVCSVVSNWSRETNNKVKLSFYTNDELSQKTQRAIQAGNPPDVLMNDGGARFMISERANYRIFVRII